MMRKNENGVVFVGFHVDDCLLIGNEEAIEKVIQDLKNENFNLKLEGTLEDYLSCAITFNKDETVGWIHQPHLIAKLEKKFEPLVKELQRYKTPAAPGKILLRNYEEIVDEEKHALCRSGVGMLLHLVKHTRPDIANAVREQSKSLKSPGDVAFSALLRLIKFALDTRNFCLKFEPVLMKDENGNWVWTIVAHSDSDNGTDPETRMCICGFILYFMGVPVSWRSKSAKSVTLSSSEAEFVALSEAAKEIKFVCQVLESMGIKVKLPIVVRVDDVGTVFVCNNVSVSQRTKHVDIRLRFVNQFVFEGFIKIIFVKSEDNDSDIFTKNLSGDAFDRHSKKLVVEKGKEE